MGSVLVTGASGFVGRHLVEALLRRGDRVRCLVRKTSRSAPLAEAGAELVLGDVRDRASLGAAVQGMDVVYHVAGVTTAFRASDLVESNAVGTANVAAACAASDRTPVHLVVSSIAAAGPTLRHRLRREEDTPAPVSNYGRSKRGGEIAAARWAGNVPTTIVRPGVVFGPRNQEILTLIRMIDRFRVHLVPGFEPPPLSYIHIDDLVQVLVHAAENGKRLVADTNGVFPSQGYYFACVGEHPNYCQFGSLIARALGGKHFLPLRVADSFCMTIAAAMEGVNRIRGHASPINSDKLREATVDSWACSNAAIRSAFDFHPQRSLVEHLRNDINWYRQHGQL